MPAAIVIPFGPFEPDSADLNSAVLAIAKNVYPAKGGFLPAKGLGTEGATLSGTTPRGACVIQTGNAAFSVYVWMSGAGGTFRRVDSSAFQTDNAVSGPLTASADGEFARFAKFGNFLLAVHANIAPQVLNWSTLGSFAALGGSPPQATGVFTIGDFVFLVGLASNRRKVRWSAINDHTGWTVGTNLCDEQELPDGGDVLGIVGDKSGFVVQQNCIRTFQFLPGDTSTIFEFHKIDGVPGCAGMAAWAKAGQSVYYYSEEGFCSIGPGGFKAIGAHRVDRYFLSLQPYISSIQAVPDAYNSRVIFAFSAALDGQGLAASPSTRALVYDWQLDRWSELTREVNSWVDALDGVGGGAQMVITHPAKTLYKLNGSNDSATLTTADLEVFQSGQHAGKRAFISAIRPLVDGSVQSVSTAAKERLRGIPTTTTADSLAEEINGRFSLRASGAYHKLSCVTQATNTATFHKGLQVWAQPDGEA